MGKVYSEINDTLRGWLEAQKIFFVGTAPLQLDGHVNCSPKGLDSFHILGAHEVLYLDLIGSGIETIAHLKENGRIVLMFCAFEGSPRIVRLIGGSSLCARPCLESTSRTPMNTLWPHLPRSPECMYWRPCGNGSSLAYGLP